MKFVYTPEGAEPKTWPFDPKKLMNAEAATIERLTGMTFTEWEDVISRGSVIATHALLYVFLKREVPTLKPTEVVFSMSEVSVELDDEESSELLKNLEERASRVALTPGEENILQLLRETTAADDASSVADAEPADDEVKADEDPKDD